MGGALDSTNVIEVPEVAVITNIGLDHTEFLGNTLEEIALRYHMALGSVKSSLFRTRKKLRTFLEQEGILQ